MAAQTKMSLVRRVSLFGTMLCTLFSGVLVGRDQFGNRYYRARRSPKGLRERRWVLYAGESEASTVPPEWHGWLHHVLDAPLSAPSPFHKPWQKPHQPNPTGGDSAYFPPGHASRGGQRARATGDYEAWQPQD